MSLSRSGIIRLSEALALLPLPSGAHSRSFLQRGSADVKLAVRPAVPPTLLTPHAQDEVYGLRPRPWCAVPRRPPRWLRSRRPHVRRRGRRTSLRRLLRRSRGLGDFLRRFRRGSARLRNVSRPAVLTFAPGTRCSLAIRGFMPRSCSTAPWITRCGALDHRGDGRQRRARRHHANAAGEDSRSPPASRRVQVFPPARAAGKPSSGAARLRVDRGRPGGRGPG